MQNTDVDHSRDRNMKLVRRAEAIGHFIMLLILLEAFLPLMQKMTVGDFDPVEGDPLRRALLLVGYLFLVPALMFYPKRAFRMVIQSPLLWFLAILAFVSVFWSGVPDLTLRRSAAVLLTTLYGLTLAVRFSFDDLLELLGWALWLCLILSLFLILFLPDWGFHTYQGELVWRGIFAHKNSLGNKAVLSLLVMMTLWSQNGAHPKKRWVWGVGIALATLMLIGSKSATGLVLTMTLVLGAVMLYFMRSLQRSWQIILPAGLIIGGLVAIVVVDNYQTILTLFGRGSTLTGRIPLWQNILPLAMDRFWLGYGYSSFWLGWEGPSAQIWSVLTWQPGYAHNGYLDLWLNLGMIGLIAGLVLILELFIYAFYIHFIKAINVRFWILFLMLIILLNATEGTFLRTNSIWWVMIVYVASIRRIKITPNEIRPTFMAVR